MSDTAKRKPLRCSFGKHRWALMERWPIPGTVNAASHWRCLDCGKEAVKVGY